MVNGYVRTNHSRRIKIQRQRNLPQPPDGAAQRRHRTAELFAGHPNATNPDYQCEYVCAQNEIEDNVIM